MPKPSAQQRQAALRRFAKRRTPMSVIIATLGNLSDAERLYFKRQQGIVELQAGVNNAKTKLDSAGRHAALKNDRNTVPRRKCENPKRRARLEKNSEKWLRWYCAETYFLPMEAPHRAIIGGVDKAEITGGRFVVAAERGIGKSFLMYGLVIKMALSGEQIFPVYIPWGDKDKGQGFDFWMRCLVNNDRIDADYPEITAPFRHSDGVSQRLAALTWEDTGEPTHARMRLSRGVIIFPDGRGYIGSSTMNGNPRGLNATQPNGKGIRPTMAMIDDVQDDKVAASQGPDGLVAKTIKKINGAVSGLKRAGASFPILMSGNCIDVGDVMDHFLNHSGWDAVRVSCISKWPIGWKKDSGKVHDLWTELGEKFNSGIGDKAFYRANKAKMTKGMVLSSPKAYLFGAKEAASDKRKRMTMPIDAKHAVIREYIRMGHDAFMSERQQSPEAQAYSIYALTPELIQSRADDECAWGIVPDWAIKTVAATDVNRSYALTTVVVAFGANQRAAVVWYGLYKNKKFLCTKNTTPAEQRKRIYEGLAAHGIEIAGLSCRPNLWIIDGLGSPEGTVIDLAANAPRICGLEAACSFGRGWKMYRQTGKHKIIKGEQWHRTVESRAKQWVIWNSDYWKDSSHMGWTGAPGGPGSCSLPRGKHDDFTFQISNEPLMAKGVGLSGKTEWIFDDNGIHDFGDCMAMAYMGASMVGIGTGGYQEPTRGRKNYTHADLRR